MPDSYLKQGGDSSRLPKAAHGYLEIFAIIQRRDKDIAMAFDNLRRSTALTQVTIIYSEGLLTQEEFLRFSQETRSIVEMPRSGQARFF